MSMTRIFLIAGVAIVIVYDVAAYFIGGQAATISWFVWTLSHEEPIVPFVAGVVSGHLFWRITEPTK